MAGHAIFLYFPNADMPSGLDMANLNGKQDPIRPSHTTVQAYYTDEIAGGEGMEQNAGYAGSAGVGAGAGPGGQLRIYTIESQHKGSIGGKAKVIERWSVRSGLLKFGDGECKDKAPYAW